LDNKDKRFDPANLKAHRELYLLKLRLKSLDEKYNTLEKRGDYVYNPESLSEKERHYPAPIEIPEKDFPEEYEVPNGLLGVKRDLFNKLATHRWAYDRDLQQRYEISEGLVPWKDHFGFKLKRPHQPPPNLNPEPLGRKSKR
jgi:hypothetical protein